MPDVDATEALKSRLATLPAGFVWGAATAAFQIEGDAGHRGRSIWDRFCERPGAILDGSNGLVACDHVNRYPEDVALLRGLGVDAYRFSVAWPRVQPGGKGPLAASGLAFYDRLIDALLEAGVQPWATLYHWDLPEELQDTGGWADRHVVDRFAEYAVALHAALGDRVRHWATFNEPWVVAWLGHGSGVHAPGVADHARAARAAHHLLLAHGRALGGMREQSPADHQLGIVLNPAPIRAADPALADELAEPVRRIDAIRNRWWLDPLFRGAYPQDALDLLAPYLDGVIHDGDLAEIARPIDFLGVNYYNDDLVVPAATPGRDDAGQYPGVGGYELQEWPAGGTAMRWPITPDGFREILVRIGRDYPSAPPLVVTENGSAWDDDAAAAATPSGPVPDPERVAYLISHLSAITDAVDAGADVRGYFAWSLLDNFEWAWGYSQRFGLVRVDYATQERRPKASYEVYRDLVAVRSRTSA